MDDHKHTNHLINETSPYLLQHAHNPVEWYPWAEEALDKAKLEGKLLVVSIGYSSCHWCHVMEHESFEDSTVARLMNDHFVSIKVDREERPDIDNIYMTGLQLLNQQGGWPLNCIALPDGRPIWGGTYFPKERWKEVLTYINNYYSVNQEKTVEYASELAEGIRQHYLFNLEEDPPSLDRQEMEKIVKAWVTSFDKNFGGHQGAPKFPLPVNLDFLLHYGYQFKDHEILDQVCLTLTMMARGGIYDQAGGGFSRYSVDQMWKVPHFEKMLYDNAQLIGLYSRSYLVFKNPVFREVVRQSIDFLEREMISEEGAFYSSIDADSEGNEGKYYIWEKSELEHLLGNDFELFSKYYNINRTGLWENNQYILYRTSDSKEFAKENRLDHHRFYLKLQQWNKLLLEQRLKRIPPGLDDKSLTSWNALTISGLVQAYHSLGDPHYLELALKNGNLIRNRLWKNGVLFRNFKNNIHSIPGFHIDYALFAEACIDLFEASMDKKWLDLALELTDAVSDRFYDPASGMFKYNPKEAEVLISNNIEIQDNVIPSSNAVTAHNLWRLGHITASLDYLERSESMMKEMTGRLKQHPYSFARWGSLYLKQQNPYYEIAVTGPSATTVLKSLSKDYLPNATLAGSDSESDIPLFRDRYSNDKTLIFVCRDNVCQLPSEDTEYAKAIYHIR